jgi:O-antigen ligase
MAKRAGTTAGSDNRETALGRLRAENAELQASDSQLRQRIAELQACLNQRDRLALFGFPAVAVSGFLMPNRADWHDTATGAIWLLLAYYLVIFRPTLQTLGASIMIPLATVTWLTASVTWTPGISSESAIDFIVAGATTAAFFTLTTLHVRYASPDKLQMAITALLAAASASMVYALYTHVVITNLPLFTCESPIDMGYCRIETFAILRSKNLGALIISTLALVALRLAISSERRLTQAALIFFILLSVFYIVAVGSRSALLALAVGSAVLLALSALRATIKLICIGLPALGMVLLATAIISPSILTPILDLVLDLVERPHFRAGIWGDALSMSRAHLWIGHGAEHGQVFGDIGTHPHNLFLAALFYSGMIGLALVILTLAAAFGLTGQILHARERAMLFAMLTALTIGTCLDSSLPLSGASNAEVWYYFWAPLGLVWGLYARSTVSRAGIATAP